MELNPIDHIWLQQEYESDKEYLIFQKYLNQPTKRRSLLSAYRDYILETTGDHERANKTQTSGSIANIALGKDGEGNPLGRPTWKERAVAHDEYFSLVQQEYILKKRDELYERERGDYLDLLGNWQKLNDYFGKSILEKMQKGAKLNSRDITAFETIVKTRTHISEGERKALGLPNRETEDRFISIEKSGDKITVEWVDPI